MHCRQVGDKVKLGFKVPKPYGWQEAICRASRQQNFIVVQNVVKVRKGETALSACRSFPFPMTYPFLGKLMFIQGADPNAKLEYERGTSTCSRWLRQVSFYFKVRRACAGLNGNLPISSAR